MSSCRYRFLRYLVAGQLVPVQGDLLSDTEDSLNCERPILERKVEVCCRYFADDRWSFLLVYDSVPSLDGMFFHNGCFRLGIIGSGFCYCIRLEVGGLLLKLPVLGSYWLAGLFGQQNSKRTSSATAYEMNYSFVMYRFGAFSDPRLYQIRSVSG
jgi:hypothetical protein